MDWDNLRFFLEVARSGTLVAAARRLGVDHTTVGRRLQALEKQLGQTLFRRESDGHQLSHAGIALLPQVEAMERAFRALPLAVAAPPDEGLAGAVRVGATEGFGSMVLGPALSEFTKAHPRLVIDLMALPRQVHLSRREADLVVSLERPVRGAVLSSKLCDYSLHLYGAQQYLASQPPITQRDDLNGHSFVTYVDDLLFSKELHFLDELYKPQRFALRSTSVLAQHQAIRAGAGLGVLPAFVAESDPALQRVLPDEARFVRSFWISMPAEAKSVPRIKAVWDFLRTTVQSQTARLLVSA